MVTMFLVSAFAAIPLWAQNRVPQPPPTPKTVHADHQAIDLTAIVSGLERAQAENKQHYRAYTMVRDYKLFSGSEPAAQSDVVAQVSFVPPNRKTFTINKVIGASRGERVVRKILEHEVKTTAQDQGSTVLNRENYNFVLLGMATVDGHACYLLQLEPKQKREDLVAGRGWIDAKAYLPRLIDGNLARNPSWWLKQVHLTLSFDDVGGMWLQTGTKAVADVRIFGLHTLTSQELNYNAGQVEARNVSPARKARSAHHPDLVGAGIFAH